MAGIKRKNSGCLPDEWGGLMSIQAQISSTESSISSEESKISDLEAKILRLKATKDSIALVKDDIKNSSSAQQNLSFLMNGWQGEQANKVSKSLVDDFSTVYLDYYGAVDALHDDINSELTRLENEKFQSEGILGGLRSLLNSLWSAFENAFN